MVQNHVNYCSDRGRLTHCSIVIMNSLRGDDESRAGCQWYAHLVFASGVGRLRLGSRCSNFCPSLNGKGSHVFVNVYCTVVFQWGTRKVLTTLDLSRLEVSDLVSGYRSCSTRRPSAACSDALQGFDYRLAMAIPDMFIKCDTKGVAVRHQLAQQ